MLGSLAEADDAVQEAWIRLSRTDTSDVDNLRAWLTTVVGRVCLNMLRSRRRRREAPLDTHVPDPIVGPEAGVDPEHEALLGDSLGLALLAVLDALTPAERVAFVLREPWSTGSREVSPGLRTAARSSSCRSPSQAAGSSRSTCSPTQTGSVGWTWRGSRTDRSPCAWVRGRLGGGELPYWPPQCVTSFWRCCFPPSRYI